MASVGRTSTSNHLMPGDPAPWFTQDGSSNRRYVFDTVAGRYVVLCFFGTAGNPGSAAALEAVAENRHHFDDTRACFFGVSIDPQDRDQARVQERVPGLRYFWDFDRTVSRLYGSVPADDAAGEDRLRIRLFWLILDPTLRVIANIPFRQDGSDRTRVFETLASLPPPERFAGFEVPPPILALPRIFEPELCQRLIALYETDGGTPSGIMREVDGKTVLIDDRDHKRRKDFTIEDPAVKSAVRARIDRRVNPEITKIFAFTPTHIERYLVGCYAAEDGGHFQPHRDNTTRGTAHRRFAVSINLNAEFEGGEISFPEYGPRSFKMPAGGAVVFPCALLHSVSRVTSGRRYAFLPFLYDEEAALVREANRHVLPGAEGDGP